MSVATGRQVLDVVDLTVPGVYPIVLTRSYDSQSRYDSPLGYGWAFSYDLQLYEYPDGSVIIRSGPGTRSKYVLSGGAFVSPPALRTTLKRNPDNTFTLRYPQGEKARFDVQGRLSALETPQGNRLEMSYDAAGEFPLVGTSPYSVDPNVPLVTGQYPRLVRIAERLADGTLTGRAVNFVYDPTTGRLSSISASDGRTVQYAHDAVNTNGTLLTKGNLTSVVGLEGIIETYAYADARDAHNITSSQQGQGMTPHVNTYDAQDRVIRQTFGDSIFTFDYSTPLVTVVDRTIVDAQSQNPRHAITTYEYDVAGRITRRIDALGNEFRNLRNEAGLVSREEVYRNLSGDLLNPQLVLEKAMNVTYDAQGFLTSKSTAVGNGEVVTRSWEYDHGWLSAKQTVSSTDPTKIFRTQYSFYRAGPSASDEPTNIKEIQRRRDDGSLETTLMTYDANGQLETMVQPPVVPDDGLVIRRRYFGAADSSPGRLREISLEIAGTADGHLKRSFTYDARGQIDTVIDARGNSTDFDFDARGRLVQVTNALGDQTRFTYSGPNATTNYASETAPPGLQLETIELGRTTADGEGQLRRRRWDARGRLLRVERKDDSGAFPVFATFTYDSDGERLSATDAVNRTTRFAYDLLQRETSIADAAASPNVTRFVYDAMGNRIAGTDAKNRDTFFAYDPLDRLVGVRQAAIEPNLVTRFAYDAAGNVTAVTDPKDQTTVYAYDALSRLLSVTQPLGQRMQYRYDGRGRLARTVNARANALQYAYLPWGGLDTVKHYATEAQAQAGQNLERTIGYVYDLEGHVTSTSDTDVSATAPELYAFSYDPINRVNQVIAKYLPQGPVTLESGYDRFGNRRTLRLNDGSGPARLHTWTFDKLNRLIRADLPGSAQPLEFQYFANDNPQKITHGNGTTTDYRYFPEGPVEQVTVKNPLGAQLLDLNYGVDKALEVDAIIERHEAGTGPYVYDYDYDQVDRLIRAQYPTALGLPLSESFAYDAAGNREDPSNAAAYDYDANGRITASPGKTYGFDDDGNTQTVRPGSTTQTLTSDKSNRLRSWTDGTTSASYLYDPFGRRIRKTVNGQTTWFLWTRDQLISEYSPSGERLTAYAYARGFAPVQVAYSSSVGEVTYQVHSDYLDTPRLLTNGPSKPAWTAVYSAFGQASINPDVDGDANEVVFNIRFPGQYYDQESGLHYNRFRYYDPGSGRFASADPLGSIGGLYDYVQSDPINLIDLLGLRLCKMRVPGTPDAKGNPRDFDIVVDDSIAANLADFVAKNAADGLNVTFNSGFRPTAQQQGLQTDPTATTPAPAGNSLHEAGRAVDYNVSAIAPGDQAAVVQNAAEAGFSWGGNFTNPAPDPQHFYKEVPGGSGNRAPYIQAAQAQNTNLSSIPWCFGGGTGCEY